MAVQPDDCPNWAVPFLLLMGIGVISAVTGCTYGVASLFKHHWAAWLFLGGSLAAIIGFLVAVSAEPKDRDRK